MVELGILVIGGIIVVALVLICEKVFGWKDIG